jgi:Dockerin type I domain
MPSDQPSFVLIGHFVTGGGKMKRLLGWGAKDEALACCWPVQHQYRFGRLAWCALYVFVSITILLSTSTNALESGKCGKDDCSISVTQTGPNTERVNITRPVVTQPFFDYKSIVVVSGDQIGIDAGGCVQTGGVGNTWKRYVNPSGPNSSRLYFGSIEIPGVLTKTRFSAILGQTITVPVISPTTLILHYADDHYSDNGYYSHDNGTQNQCAGPDGGAAHVTLTIMHAITPPPPPPPPACAQLSSSLPWDLATAFAPDDPSSYDDNCLPLNPRWLWQRPDVANVPEFTKDQSSQITGTDNSATCRAKSGGRDGHVNWIDVTYTGKVQWDGHDRHYPFGDDDYNVKLFGPTAPRTIFMAGGTEANPDNIKGEFDSDETIDNFDQSPWWKMFHNAVDADGFNTRGIGTRAGALIDGHDAVMTGLMGLDTFHEDNKSEIHPVHALAIRIAEVPDRTDDAWAVFVRNSGNEGYCGNNQHYVSRTSIAIRIPRPPELPPSATADFAAGNLVFKHNAPNLGKPFDYVLNTIPGGDAVVTFFLNTPTQKSFLYGELHLRWSVPGAPPPAVAFAPTTNGPALTTSAVTAAQTAGEEDGPEESAEERALFFALSPAERDAIDAQINAALAPRQLDSEPARMAVIVGPPEPTNEGQVVFEGPDERVEEIQDISFGALCAVTGGVTPQSPLLCEATTKVPGDLDGDRDVDQDDLNILLRGLNQSASESACGTRCDLDGDGRITIHDARRLKLLCTRPRCAIAPIE